MRNSFAPAAELTERYEGLRREALTRCFASGSRLGQAVLLSRGVVAWMQAVSSVLGSSVPAAWSPPLEPTTVPEGLPKELIQLMGEAILTLARRETS